MKPKPKTPKAKKSQISLRDLKPKKDAKGGLIDTSTGEFHHSFGSPK